MITLRDPKWISEANSLQTSQEENNHWRNYQYSDLERNKKLKNKLREFNNMSKDKISKQSIRDKWLRIWVSSNLCILFSDLMKMSLSIEIKYILAEKLILFAKTLL